MSIDKIQTLKGFRDFLGSSARARLWMIDKIRNTFELFGFEPLETPALEYEELLAGKYGDEADKLIYGFEDRGGRRIALRYDQTVPTARVISQYQSELVLPYKRYQIQPVWRADKPQKGRYREFTQADIDILGSTSPLADAEILACTYAAFKNIGFSDIRLLINDRQTLVSTLEKYATGSVSVFSIIQSIDKIEKIGKEGVIEELVSKGLEQTPAQQALAAIESSRTSNQLQEIMQYATTLGVPEQDLVYTPTLARGLDYYTGMIFEVVLPGYTAGSVAAGGRYDKLIKQLGGIDIPAVGVAFGFDRMIDAATELNIMNTVQKGAQVLVTVFNEELSANSLQVANKLRKEGVNTEVFPGIEKLEKQLIYANKKNIPFVILIGPEEATKNNVRIKNMRSGKQTLSDLSDVSDLFDL